MKNIIFDLGHVLVDFQPNAFLDAHFSDKHIKKAINDTIFNNTDWARFDLGQLSQAEFIQRVVSTGEVSQFIAEYVFYNLQTILQPIRENIALLDELMALNHYKFYILSNFPKEPFEQLKSQFTFLKQFHGEVISYQCGMVKPSEKIYKTLLEKYNLNAKESIFFDDKVENIKGAIACGIHARLIKTPGRLREILLEEGIIADVSKKTRW